MIAGNSFTNVFGLFPSDVEQPDMARLARAACQQGFAVIPLKPGGKEPLCTLTIQERRAAGSDHECGLKHAITDPDVAFRVFGRLSRKGGRLNMAVVLGRSGWAVVDVDTPEQNEAFLRAWSKATGTDQTHRTPTVLSPGTRDAEGRWVHHGGGHYWFKLPDGLTCPDMPMPGGWVLMGGEHYVLVPPSVRTEGTYTVAGQGEDMPTWLVEVAAGFAPKERPVRPRSTAANEIDAWSVGRWDAALTRDGWTPAGSTDNCGCPIWTAPGDHASPKSATAHREGCAKYDTTHGWGPLHVWTDNPPGYLLGQGKTLTPLQYEAASQHGGSVPAALNAESISQPLDQLVDMGEIELGKDQGTATHGDAGSNGTYNLPLEFWQARKELTHIRQAALHHMCSPDALLMVVLARLGSMVDHRTKLEIGLGPAGLNLIVCPVGPSSAGKGLAMDAARQLLPSPDPEFRDGLGIGSGEGIPEAFMGTVMVGTGEQYKTGDRKGEEKMSPQREQVRHNVLFTLDEGQALGKMAGRVGATIMPALRSLWSGSTLGQANASAETTRCVPAGQYAAGVVMAFQPDTAMAILADTDGLAQRALWVPATSPDVTADEVDHPGPLQVTMDPLDSGQVLLFPADIRMEYRRRRAGVVSGQVTEDPLDGHGPLVRAKVAALLCLLAGGTEPSRDDWDLAETVWQSSVRLRSHLMGRADQAARDALKRRSEARAIEATVIADSLALRDSEAAERAVRRVSRLVLGKLGQGPVKRYVLNKGLKSTDRKHLADALLLLQDMGKVTESEGMVSLVE